MITTKINSIIYNLLIKTYWLRKSNILFKLWKNFWSISGKSKFLVKTKIHGFDAIVPPGHWYLLVLKNYKKYNNPLICILNYLENQLKRPLNIIDVGTAIGDMVLLFESKSRYKNNFICIDGDEHFFQIAKNNLNFISDRVKIIYSLVSDNEEPIGKIIKENPTTGTSKSSELEIPKTIDNLVGDKTPIDFIKIDIDGYDGRAIGGITRITNKFNPIIIFEWNVPLFIETKNDLYFPFIKLEELGYDSYYWFDNFGNFLFHTNLNTKSTLEKMAIYSINNAKTNGYHYDIIAIKNDSGFINFIQ